MTKQRFMQASMLWPIAIALFACTRGTDNARPVDSAAGISAISPDTLGTQGRLASDGTLTIEATPALHAALRAAADSFASREAIRVVLSAQPATPSPDDRTPDLIVLAGNDTSRLRMDSTVWTLAFAEMDSALVPAVPAQADSAAADTAAKKPARPRRTRGRRVDTNTAPKMTAADSARLAAARRLLLTVPANAPNSAVAERFVRYLLIDGRATLLRSGLHVLPRLEVYGSGAPAGIVSLADTVLPADTSRTPEPTPGR